MRGIRRDRENSCARSESNRANRLRRPMPGSARTNTQVRRLTPRHPERRPGIAPGQSGLQSDSTAWSSPHFERPAGIAPAITEWHSALVTFRMSRVSYRYLCWHASANGAFCSERTTGLEPVLHGLEDRRATITPRSHFELPAGSAPARRRYKGRSAAWPEEHQSPRRESDPQDVLTEDGRHHGTWAIRGGAG